MNILYFRTSLLLKKSKRHVPGAKDKFLQSLVCYLQHRIGFFTGERLRNRIGGFTNLDEQQAVVSMLRGNDKNHVFILIEGVYQGKELVYESHLFQQDGQVIITLNTIVDEKLDHLAKDYYYKGWPISIEQAQRLIEAIKLDQEKAECGKLVYNKLGDSFIYAFRFGRGQTYHNCISWAEEKLKEIGLTMEHNWLDCIVMYPKYKIPKPAVLQRQLLACQRQTIENKDPEKKEETNKKERCILS